MSAIATTAECAAHPPTTLDLGTFPTPRPGLWRDPRVLDPSWASPTLLGPAEVLGDLRDRVVHQLAPERGVAVSIHGPKRSGTSSVARCVAAEPYSCASLQAEQNFARAGRVAPHMMHALVPGAGRS